MANAETEQQDITTYLARYKEYSYFTNPEEFEYLYNDLPDSLEDLCKLIKAQIIHPWSELPKYRHEIPMERYNEDPDYVTVKSMLAALMAYDSAGLVIERQPKDRLLLTCRYNAILLSSILRHRHIPVRVRYGYATYLRPDMHLSHVICEVWNQKENRWMLVDPSMNMIDFNRNQFEFSNDIWMATQRKEIDPEKYGVDQVRGMSMVVTTLCLDVASLLGNEFSYYNNSPMYAYAYPKPHRLTQEHFEILDAMAESLTIPDMEKLATLQKLYNSQPLFNFSHSLISVKPKPVSYEDTDTN